MRPRYWLCLGAAISPVLGPHAGEGRQRSIIVEPEPPHVLLFGLGVRLGRVFSEAVKRHQAPGLRLEPSPPVGRRRIPDVGDRVAAELWRWWHTPAHHNHLAIAVVDAHHRGRIVGKYSRHRRQIADVSAHHAEKCCDGGLVRGDSVEVAHEVREPAWFGCHRYYRACSKRTPGYLRPPPHTDRSPR